jgi:hypothetical protein
MSRIRFGAWLGLLLAAVIAASAVVVHQAEARAPADISGRYLAWWGVFSAASLLLLSLLGGLFVLRTRTKWEVAATWPFAGGLAIGFGCYLTLVVMGQTNPGTVSCKTGDQSCDIAFGLGAALLSLVSAVPIGGSFIATYALRRLAVRVRRRALR